jgi:hypothetical protein
MSQPSPSQWLDAALFDGEIHPDEDLTAVVNFTTKIGNHRRKFAEVQQIIVDQGGFIGRTATQRIALNQRKWVVEFRAPAATLYAIVVILRDEAGLTL